MRGFRGLFLLTILTVLLLNDWIWAQNDVLIFSVMGDIPYSSSEELILQQQITEHNLYSPSEFMVHVGDIKGTSTNCAESSYSRFANYMLELDVPTFVIPGDNEWTDCTNPEEAWSFWTNYFMNFEQNFCGAPVVERQSIRPENFAFIKKGVLIIGLNMMGGTHTEVGNWNQRLQDNADWVNQQFQEKGSLVRAAVVFGHSLRKSDELFETQFLQAVSNFGKRVLYIMGEHHSFSLRDPYKVSNLAKVIVDKGAIALPLQVTVTLNSQQQFVFNRTPWDSNSQPINRLPCGQDGPLISINPASHNFGAVAVGATASQTFVVSNSGNQNLDVTGAALVGSNAAEFNLEGGGAFTLSPGATQNVVVRFNPISEGSKSATLRLDSNDPNRNPLDASLSGNAVVPAPDLAVNPSSYDFGQVLVGANAAKTFVVTNSGDLDLNVSAVALIGSAAGEFSMDSGGGAFTLAPGANRTIQVSFNPASEGSKSATLRFDSDDPDENPLDVNLSGSGVAPAPDITVAPTSHNFGDVVVGSSSQKTFVVKNDGSADLEIGSTTLVGTDAGGFSIDNGGGSFTLPPGQSRDVAVSFAPTSLGTKTAALRFATNDLDEDPKDVSLTGSGVGAPAPDITVAPTSHNYGDVVVGNNSQQTFVVTNDGTADLEVGSTTLVGTDAGEFSIDSGGGSFALPPGQSRDVAVSFAPTSTGAKNATLRFATNDSDEDPKDVSLTGTGVDSPPPSGDVTFEEVKTGGSTSSTTVSTVSSLAGANGHVYLAAISSKSTQTVTGVSGLGLMWTRVASQCAGRNQTGIEVWMAQGNASSGVVTATFASAPSNAVIVVTRYSGVASSNPIATIISGNTNGLSGSCSGGSDNSSYSFNITSAGNGLIYGAAAMRAKNHTPGAGYSERGEVIQGSTSSGAGAAVQDRGVASSASVVLNGSFSGATDWAVIGLQIKAGSGGGSSPVPDITVAPASHNYGDVVVGNNSQQTFVVKNDGSADLEVGSTTLVGTDAGEFSIDSGGGSFALTPGQSRDVAVSFAPTSLGTKTATLRFATNDSDEDPKDVSLTGSGVGAPTPDITVTPAPHNYGDVVVGSSSQKTFVVKNDGSADLEVNSTTLVGTDAGEFSIDSGGGSFALTPGQRRDVAVSFAPTSLGTKTATLRFATNDSDEDPKDVSLTGSGVGAPTPDITVTPATHNYGDVVVGNNSQQTFVVKNDGSANLEVGSTTLVGTDAGEFSIDNGGGSFTLTPGQSRDVAVSFAPTSLGTKTATLRFATNDSDEDPKDVSLTGSGVDSPPPSAEITFEEVKTGASSSVNSVATSASLAGVSGHLYLAAIAMKSFVDVNSVSGLGLTWTRVRSQCAGRNQTGVEVWMAQGNPSGDGLVTATLAAVPKNAVIVVCRYSGTNANPIGAVVSGNTTGVNGVCSGGVDNAAYSFSLTTSVSGAVVYGAVTMRERTHTPGAGYTERAEILQGASGAGASCAVEDKTAAAGVVTVNGSFNNSVDWAMIGLEIRPQNSAAKIAANLKSEKVETEQPLPSRYQLFPSYPNPFNAETTIEYSLPARAQVQLKIYNVRGQMVRVLVDGEESAGIKRVLWDGKDEYGSYVGSGTYFMRLEAGGRFFTHRLTLQK